MLKRCGLALLGAMLLSFLPFSRALAVPFLQLYIEGSTYDPATETWVFSGSGDFTLWVMGNVNGPGGKGTILDVNLVAAYSSSEAGSITITSTTAGLVGDPSTPSDASFSTSGNDTVPLMSDGSPLPNHGEYGPGVSWGQYSLGDFTLTDSPVADLIDAFPPYPGTGWTEAAGQINAYSISVSGFTSVHFDAFDHVESTTKSKFAPFSHDAAVVPEPGTLLLLGSGLIGLAGWGRKKFRR